MTTKELDQQYVLPTYARFPLEITHGKGPYCYDENGREYIDLGSGIGVNAQFCVSFFGFVIHM